MKNDLRRRELLQRIEGLEQEQRFIWRFLAGHGRVAVFPDLASGDEACFGRLSAKLNDRSQKAKAGMAAQPDSKDRAGQLRAAQLRAKFNLK